MVGRLQKKTERNVSPTLVTWQGGEESDQAREMNALKEIKIVKGPKSHMNC